MSIPLDRLYHFIENIAEEIHGDRVIIYHFWPHGSKNLNDFNPLRIVDLKNLTLNLKVLCADQEPLDYDCYEKSTSTKAIELNEFLANLGVNSKIKTNLGHEFYIKYSNHILLHSEKRSSDVEKYQQAEYIPTYYWSHGLISRDWFRYAKHEQQTKSVTKNFLIYNRAWSGTREYRLKFADLLVNNNLINHCQTTLNVIEPELNIHYSDYHFDNPVWKPSQKLDQYFPPTLSTSCSSADYNIDDYNSCDFEIVLETLFDDDRLHLTEKSLRPIALGQPFILMASYGSLEYLRNYGFRTFDSVIDESYDQIKNPVDRMQAVINLMNQIVNWTESERIKKISQMQIIADYNRMHFFSDNFFNYIVNELKNNLRFSMNQPLFSIQNVKSLIDLLDYVACHKNLKEHSKNIYDINVFSELNKILEVAKLQYQKLLSIDK